MTEIKLTKRYPQSRTEDIVDAYMRGWNDALDAVQNGKFHIAEQTEPTGYNLSPVEDEPQIDCDTNCLFWDDRAGVCMRIGKCPTVKDEPQTDCAWR